MALNIGTKVKLTKVAKEDTYFDMDWKEDTMVITHIHDDDEGMGKLYSFDSISSDKEITCSMYAYELRVIKRV